MKYRSSNRVTAGNRPVQPIVWSYDTSYEHSLEHYVAVRRMVEKADMVGTAVSGIYRDLGMVDHAVDVLREAEFRNHEISLLFTTKQEQKDFARNKQSKARGRTASMSGGVGWLAETGALAIAGVGLLSAVSPIVSATAGAEGMLDGIADALLSMGVPKYQAKRYAECAEKGGIVLSVHAENSDWIGRAKNILEQTRADDIFVVEAEAIKQQRTVQRLPRAS